MPHLIQLMHGSTCGLKRLVIEFRAFWLKKNDQPTSNCSDSLNDSGDTSMLNDSISEPVSSSIENKESSENKEFLESKGSVEKTGEKESMEKSSDRDEVKCEDGQGCSISIRQLEIKISSIGVREKRPGFNQKCWYVHAEVLAQFKMESLSLPNTWVYTTLPPSKSPNPNLNKSINSSKVNQNEVEESEKEVAETKPNDQRSIMAFTMSREEILKQESLKPKPEPKVVEPMEVDKAETVTNLLKDQQSQIDTSNKTEESGKSSSLNKTPTVNKKPKVSVMDMLIKSSATKKKLAVFANEPPVSDCDIKIIEVLPPKNEKDSVDNQFTIPKSEVKDKVAPMEVESSSSSKDVGQENKSLELPTVDSAKLRQCSVSIERMDDKQDVNMEEPDVICID